MSILHLIDRTFVQKTFKILMHLLPNAIYFHTTLVSRIGMHQEMANETFNFLKPQRHTSLSVLTNHPNWQKLTSISGSCGKYM